MMHRLLSALTALTLLLALIAAPWVAIAAPAGGVVGGACTESDLNTALAGGGIITFNCGGPKTIVLTSAKTISAATTLLGGDVITLTGGLATRLFSVSGGVTFSLGHIILDRAAASGPGGAIFNGGTLNLDHVTIQNSQATGGNSGGAIASFGALNISDSQFLTDTAAAAGALYAFSGQSIVNIRNSTFDNNETLNTTTGIGGAIWISSGARLTITDGEIFENTAGYGGALYVSPGTQVTLTAANGLDLFSNVAGRSGGGIYNEGGTLRVINTNLTSNQTPFTTTANVGLGGAIASFGPLALTGDQFTGNQSSVGGGVFISSTTNAITTSIDRSNLTGNSAGSGSGGGLFVGGANTVLTIDQSTFIGNIAQGSGGALYRYGAYLNISRSSFTGNVAHHGGAGLFLDGPTPATGEFVNVRDTTLNTNTDVPSTTAGAAIRNLAEAQLINVTLKDNSDGLDTLTNATTTIANTVIDNKLANCTGLLPQDNLGNFVTNFSDCGVSVTESGPDALLGPVSFDPRLETAYYRPLPGSPLIGAAVPACDPHDQLDEIRPSACDAGAVQHNGLYAWLYVPLVRR
jgi:hypothetical protein